MSRHEIPARNPDDHKVIVGWDHPLLTFFAQVIDRAKEAAGDDENDKFVLWVGASPRELYEVEQLEWALRKFAVLSADMASTLYGDKDEGR